MSTAEIARLAYEMTGGWMIEARTIDTIEKLIAGPDAVRELRARGTLAGAGVLVDNCATADDAAELFAFARSFEDLAALVDWAEHRLAGVTPPRAVLDVSVWPGLEALVPWLAALGFHAAYDNFDMRREGGPTEEPALPAGMRWAPYEDRWLDGYHAAASLAFREIPGSFILPKDRLAARSRALAIPPDLLLDGDTVAGFVRVVAHAGGTGEIGILARHPAYRRRALGPVLLRHGLALLAARGITRVDLDVATANHDALTLYEQHGFRRLTRRPTWRKPLKAWR